MKAYQKWYRRIVHAGLLSLLAILLTMGVALAEEVTIGNTDDVLPGSVQLVTQSADGNGVYADHAANYNHMADDGSFVFTSNAKNLVTPATTGGVYRFYFFDNATKTVTVLPSFGTDRLGSAQITPDKQWVLLNTFDYTLKIDKVFLYNTATAELMSMKKADGTTLAVKGLSITADGSIVAFSSLEKLVPADTNNLLDVYLWHRGTKAIELASKKSDGTAAGIESFGAISADGIYVSYIASGSNFPSCGTQTYYDIYRQNVQTSEVLCVSGEVDDSDHEIFRSFQMSTDGTMIAFTGIIDGIRPKSTNFYLVNLSLGTTPTVVFDEISLSTLIFYRLTADGKQVIYSNGIYTDPNNLRKFCVYEIATASHSCTTRPEGTQDGDITAISPTGRFSVISSWDHSWIGSIADNVKPTSNDRWDELFIWDSQGVNNAISGKVTGDDGTTGLADVILTNGSRERYVTDANGNYTMPYLNIGQYEITPTLSGKTFYPTNKIVTTPRESVDFSTQQKLTINGRVADKDDKGIADAVIKTDTGDYLTDVNGFYSIAGLVPGSYVLTPTVTGLIFEPRAIQVNLVQDEADVNFQQICVSPHTGLNVCDLEVGDILLWRGNFAFLNQPLVNTIARIGIGAYWWHAGLYIGDGRIVEALQDFPTGKEQYEVIWRYVEYSPWWLGNDDPPWWIGNSSFDWSVIRPNVDMSKKQLAANYALTMALLDNPPVEYVSPSPIWNISPFFDRDSDSPTYCSKLVWKAYMQSSTDLERDFGVLGGTIFQPVISADDLYYSAIEMVNQPAVANIAQEYLPQDGSKVVFFLLSPADLVLTDSQGRRVGHNPLTGVTYDEIPGALYSGPDTEPESISLLANTTLTWTLGIVGTGNGGQYTIKTAVISDSQVLTGTLSSTIAANEQKTYQFNILTEQSDELLEEQQPVEDRQRLYLPIVVR